MSKGRLKIGRLQNLLPTTLLLLVLVIISSCGVGKFLQKDEWLIEDFEISFDEELSKKEKWIENGLRYWIQQKRNGRVLWIPKEYIFLSHSEKHDTSKYDEVMRNVMGEEPALYNKDRTLEAISRMESWLKFNKGYYHARVGHHLDTISSYKVDVVFDVHLGERFKYGSLEFLSKDTSILNKVKNLWAQGKVKAGSYVDSDAFGREKNRITEILQNDGYANFASKYFGIKGDSTRVPNTIDAIIEVYLPENEAAHTQYDIGAISVFTDYHAKQDTFGMIKDTVENITYYSGSSKFLVKPKVLDKVISFREGEMAIKEKRLQTFTKLSNLSTYRFTAINPYVDSLDSTKINYNILLTPHTKKWIGDYGGDILFSRLGGSADQSGQNRNVFGASLNSQLVNRNFLGGSERFAITGEVGGQIEIGDKVNFRSFNYGISNYLEYPIFKDHFRQISSLHQLGFLRKSTYDLLKEKAQSTINASINLTDVRSFYRILILNTSYGYKLQYRKDRSLSINTLGVTLNNYELREKFLERVGDNPLILNTFNDNLFSGFLFRNLFYTRNGYLNDKSWQWAYYLNAELSGLEVLAANELYNQLSGENNKWTVGKDRFKFAKFGKIEVDLRLYKDLGKKYVIASRFNTGIINPFADSETSPFIKQFEVGGPNSLRGWGARELGPGATQVELTNDVLPFQKGDIKIEANLEYRFPIWWLFQGGLFVDAGNIWRLKQDENGEGKFTKDFIDEIAVAAGWGLRFDVDYFIIRMDFGYRVRNPYPSTEVGRIGKHWRTWENIRSQGIGNFQVNVSHAF